MALFSRKPAWEKTFRLRSQGSGGRSALAVLFWIWGLAGLLFNGGALLGLTGSIGVGTSAYLAATALVWIGGMMLFGIGALLAISDFDGERPVSEQLSDVRITE
jgi:hypothetical protein